MPEQDKTPETSKITDTAGGSESAQVRFDGEPSKQIEEESIFDKILGISIGAARIPDEILTSFLRQLVMLLEAGVTLLKATNTLASRISNKVLRNVLRDVADRIESGTTLWQSLSNHPKHFNHLFVSIIKAGETSGTLPAIITRLSDYREKRALLRKQVRSALTYPIVVFVAGLAVLILFLVFVLPEFEALFNNFDIELPAITKVALGGARILVKLWWLWPLIIAGIVAAIVAYARTPSGRFRIDYIKLRMPLFGKIMTEKVVADFAHTFATLLNAGISILETLELTKDAVGNVAFAEDLQNVRDSIERGEGLEKPLRQSKLVPPLVTDLLTTGEEAGSLEKISRQVAEIFEQQVESSVSTLKSLIEPVMILGLGLIVMFLVLSFFVPYVSMLGQISSL
jgi:type IV pilus assembly protein PilC